MVIWKSFSYERVNAKPAMFSYCIFKILKRLFFISLVLCSGGFHLVLFPGVL